MNKRTIRLVTGAWGYFLCSLCVIMALHCKDFTSETAMVTCTAFFMVGSISSLILTLKD